MKLIPILFRCRLGGGGFAAGQTARAFALADIALVFDGLVLCLSPEVAKFYFGK
jgi:hypothetical protein